MIRWKDVLKTLVICAAVLFLIFVVIWGVETNMEIRSIQDDIARLKSAQRPLVQLQGKYVTVFTKEDEVIIETAQENTQ